MELTMKFLYKKTLILLIKNLWTWYFFIRINILKLHNSVYVKNDKLYEVYWKDWVELMNQNHYVNLLKIVYINHWDGS